MESTTKPFQSEDGKQQSHVQETENQKKASGQPSTPESTVGYKKHQFDRSSAAEVQRNLKRAKVLVDFEKYKNLI